MKRNGANLRISVATMLLACIAFSSAVTASQDARPAVSESVRAEVEKLGNTHEAYSAVRALADRGDTIVPELITALEDTLGESAQYDPHNLGDAKDEYFSLRDRQVQLMGLVGNAGKPEHVDRLTGLADRTRSERMDALSYFRMLDALGARDEADRIAAQFIADPASDNGKLMAAMVRYYRRTPDAVADSAAQHFDKEFSIVRGMAYQLVINAGRGDAVRARLVDEVSKMEYADGGNKTMLHALAVIEESEAFLPRMESVRLRPDVKRTATLISRFTWTSDEEREAMIPDMLHTNNRELDLYAIEFMLENDRVDLLEKYRLAWPGVRQMEYYEMLIPGFAGMSRERLLRHLPPEQVDAIERQKDLPLMPMTTPTMRLALQRLGYTLEKRDGTIAIIPPAD